MWEMEKRKMTQEEREELCKKDMEEWVITNNDVNNRICNHIKRFYNSEWKLDINWFFDRAKEVVNILFEQPWENRTFWTIEQFKEFLIKWLKLYILDYNLDYETSKKLRKSMIRLSFMYWEFLTFWDEITDWVKKYLKENRNNEQKKEEIKMLIEKDYEIFFWEWSSEKILDTKVWQNTNDIIEVFSMWYYSAKSNLKLEE